MNNAEPKLDEKIQQLETKLNTVLKNQQQINEIMYFNYLLSIMKDPEPLEKK